MVCNLRYVVVSVFILSGCHNHDYAAYTRLVKDGIATIPYAAKMDSTFEEVDHYIGSHVSNEGTRTWRSESFFGGRYHLTMEIEIVVSFDGGSVRTAGEPVFRLFEVAKVTDNDGQAETDFNSANQKTFGPKEMDAILKSKGRLDAVGIDAYPGPIPNFAFFRKSVGKPRIKVRGHHRPAADAIGFLKMNSTDRP